ncbi:hypothetical protein OsI_34924 [Oryza sativa Indica Group]|uniref:Uncharacterized protein n=1 Tax=Oryza sativa subsp. indica TaxID=39946 RepID=B8BIU0_ORYSI|nr:hypothetical protein OsI_34924 [Oryza sativa Indica Group]
MRLLPPSSPRPLLRPDPSQEPAVATQVAAEAGSVVEAAAATAPSAGEASAAEAGSVTEAAAATAPPVGEASACCRHPGHRRGRLAHRRIREAAAADAVCEEKE